MTNIELKNKLQDIANQKQKSIEQMIAYEALNFDTDCKNFFIEIQNIGDATGIANAFIYESDIDTYFETYSTQIMEIQEEYREENDITFLIKGDLKRNLSWLAYEQTAIKMAKELGLEV
tara:strand:- start:120921 stop:121277 length:357 start_codon:yes stop_codon:yes gene_type:complete